MAILPFLATFDLNTKKLDIIWRCNDGYFESVVRVLNPDKLELLTRKENEKEVPNYWIKKSQSKNCRQADNCFHKSLPANGRSK
jgi:hypothetical protein